MTYSYYLTMRPACPGAQPSRGLKNIIDLNGAYIPAIRHTAYALLEYDRTLTDKEVFQYELAQTAIPEEIYKGYVIRPECDGYAVYRDAVNLIAVCNTIEEAKEGIDSLD